MEVENKATPKQKTAVTILLAEDDKFISKAYKDGLTMAGFKVELAGNGAEAVTKSSELSPDIILLDLIMPDKNGFEALKEIKDSDITKNIPVIILSNLGQDTDITKCKQLGACDYLIKANFTMAEVVDKIAQYLPRDKKPTGY